MDKEVFSFEPLMSFVPHAIATDENPRLAGFPANLLYMGKRDETGLPYAIYVPDLILGREPRTPFLEHCVRTKNSVSGARLCSTAEVCIYRNVPGFEQPFRDVAAVLVLFAPGAKLGGANVVLGC